MFGNIFNQKKEQGGQIPPTAGQTPPADQNQELQPQTLQNPADAPVQQPTPTDPSAVQQGDQSAAGQSTDGTASNTVTPGQPSIPGQSAAPGAPQSDVSGLSHLDPRSGQALTHAQEETRRIKQQYIEPEQLLLGLLYDQQIYSTLGEMAADGGQISKEIQATEKMGVYKGQPTLSKISQEVFEQAYRDAKMRGVNFISPEDILVVLFSPNYTTAAVLQKHNLKKEALIEKFSKTPNNTYGKRTVLEKYGLDLTEEARAGKLDPVAGRDKEIDRMVHILLRRTKNNPIIIGETGVGKTAIVEGLAQKIVQGSVPKDLLEKRIFQLDVASLIAGASHRGEFEERLRGVINEVLGSNNRIILFIDEIHALMGSGDDGGMNAANIIKPHLARGHFQLIGATTTIEYRKNFEKDKAFERRFQPVTCEEPSEENAFEMLKVIRPKYEKFHHITFPDDALKECVKLSKKYIGERYLPDKAIDLLDEAAAEVKLQIDAGNRNNGNATVKKADIEKVVSAWTGIPITKLTEDESEKLLKLEDRIHHRLIDQEQAVVAVSEAVRRGRIGLAAANRPIASFVFLGPTGVGKTELAKTLAELLFGRDDAMARLDMSEYMEKHEVAKLIGAPPGYVGYEEGGQLTEAVRKKPYSIVLLDEIEKAHPDVFNILLQLLEDGRLTDNKGNTISFKNTIVICTSNIGSAIIQQKLSSMDPKAKKTPEEFEQSFKELQGVVKDELIKFFRPELLNRFDEVVIFKPLQPEHMAGIARLGIAKTAKLLKEQGYGLQITERAIAQLATDGYDPVYGARPLRRLIQTAIENPIALAIISKKFVPGDTIVIDYSDNTNEFFFNKDGGEDKIAPMTDEQFRTFLQQLSNTDSVNITDRPRFMEVHDMLVKGRSEKNNMASDILEVNASTPVTQIQAIRKQLDVAKTKGDTLAIAILELASSVAHQIQASLKLKHILLEIIHPEEITQPAKKARFLQLHDKVTQEGQRENALALKILAVNETTPSNAIDALMEELKTGANNGEDLATEILAAVNAEITEDAEEAHAAEPLSKFKKVLQQIINPLYTADPENKVKFSKLYDKISEADKANNPLATAILALTDLTSDADIKLLKEQLENAEKQGDELAKEILLTINQEIERLPIRNLKKATMLVVNPMNSQIQEERAMYIEIQKKITEEGQKGNQLATAVLTVKETSTDEEMKKLLEQLVAAQAQHDEVAEIMLTLAGDDDVKEAQPAVDQTHPGQQPQDGQTPQQKQDSTVQPTQPGQDQPPSPVGVAMPTTDVSQQSATEQPAHMSEQPDQTNASLFTPSTPPANSAIADSTPGAAINGNGATMQPSNAYNYAGIPVTSRPVNYVAPQSSQEGVE